MLSLIELTARTQTRRGISSIADGANQDAIKYVTSKPSADSGTFHLLPCVKLVEAPFKCEHPLPLILRLHVGAVFFF